MSDIYKVLDELKIPYEKHEHEAVFTFDIADKLCQNIAGGHIKNLFLRNKKGDKHYLVVVEGIKTVDLKQLRKDLGESKLSFGSPERLMEHLGITPGSVSPLSIVNNDAKDVIVIFDEGLLNFDVLNCHPNINTATLSIKRDDLMRFLEQSGNELRVMKL